MKSISTFGETQGDMVPSITESVTVFSFDAVGFALKFHLVSPGKSGNRTSPVLGLHFSGYRVYQELSRTVESCLVYSAHTRHERKPRTGTITTTRLGTWSAMTNAQNPKYENNIQKLVHEPKGLCPWWYAYIPRPTAAVGTIKRPSKTKSVLPHKNQQIKGATTARTPGIKQRLFVVDLPN